MVLKGISEMRRLRVTSRLVLMTGLMLGGSASAENLNMSVSAAITTLDPHMTSTVQTNLSVASHIYTPLVTRGPDLKLKPAAAESWKVVDDLTWRFKIRPGITFANGEALDANAVKWNIDRILDPKNKIHNRPWFEPITEVKVLGPTELEIRTAKPYPALADQMSMFFILPPQWSASHDLANDALGSGPYELVSFVPGDRVVLKARPNYFEGKPEFDEVVIRSISEPSVRVAAVLAGEIDLAVDIPPSDIERINASGKANAGATPSVRSMFVKINTLKAPFKDNLKLRQALNYAIDKKAIIDVIFNGHGTESNCQVLTPLYFGYNEDLKPYPYDPEKARALVKESGVATPIPVEFEIPLGRYLLSEEIGQVIAAQLEDVGFSVKIQEMEFGSYINKYIRGNDLGQLSYLGQAWPTLDADGLLTLFEPGNVYAYWNNRTFGDLLNRARTTVDAGQRKELYKQATKVMCEDAPVAFLFAQPLTYAVSNRIKWNVRGDDWVRAYDVNLK